MTAVQLHWRPRSLHDGFLTPHLNCLLWHKTQAAWCKSVNNACSLHKNLHKLTSSQIFSSAGIQLVARWQFCRTTHEPSAMPRCTICSAIEPYIYIHAHADIVTSIQARSRHYLQIPFKECDQQPFTQELLQYYYTRLTVHTKTPSLNFYRPDLFLTPNQQCHSTEGKHSLTRWTKPLPLSKLWLQQVTLNTGLNFTSLAAVGYSLRHSVCLSRLCLL